MYRHNKILSRTIYDKNEYILYSTYAEILLYNTKGEEVARTKVDLDKVEDLKNYKLYRRKHGGDKYYVALSINSKKYYCIDIC